MKPLRLIPFCMGLFILSTIHAQAVTNTWVGLVSNDWNVANNWLLPSVPGQNDDVIILAGTPNSPSIDNEVTIKSLTINDRALLEITADGILKIDGADGTGLAVGGTLVSRGEIYINETLEDGLAIYNEGEARLHGDTYIGDTKNINGHGVLVQGQLILSVDQIFREDLTPSLIIDRTSNSGIHCNAGTITIGEMNVDGSAGFTQLFIGTANIRSIGQYGILNEGTIECNAGRIQIESTGLDGIQNATDLPSFGRFTVQTNAVLQIGSTNTLIGRDGLLNNEGGEFINSGQLMIFNTDRYGIISHSSFQNQTDGTILIEKSSQDAIFNVAGEFDNRGNIAIIGDDSSPFRGIQNRAVFINKSEADIFIERATNYAVYNLSEGSIDNQGNMTLGNFGAQRIGATGFWNEGFFNNSKQGELIINNTRSSAIVNQSGGFRNEALIRIGSNAPIDNMGIESHATFINSEEGSIHIDQANGMGIQVFSQSFSNDGQINIGKNGQIGLNAIRLNSEGAFSNNSCASLIHIFSGGISDASNTIFNNGLIIQEGLDNSEVGTNNGVILFDNLGTLTVASGNQPISLASAQLTEGLWIGCTSTQWSDPTNWYGQVLPTADRSVTITSGFNSVDIADSDIAICKSLFLERGSILNNAGQLNVTDSLFWIKEGASITANSGRFEISGNLLSQGEFAIDTSTVLLNGTQNNRISGNPITFYNLQVDKPSGTVSIETDINVLNEFDINTGTVEVQKGAALNIVELTLENGTQLINNEYLSTRSEGNLWIKQGAILEGNGTYDLGGNWLNDGTFKSDSSVVNFIGTMPITSIDGSSNTIFYDLILDKESGILQPKTNFTVQNSMRLKRASFENQSGRIIVLNNFQIDSLATSEGSGSYFLTGDWINNGEFKAESSDVGFTGPKSINRIDGLNPTTFFNLIMEKDSGILRTVSNINVLNLLTLSSGTFENPSGRTINIKDLWIDNPATSKGSGSYLLSGLWFNNGTFIADESMVQFTGDQPLNRLAGDTYTTFYDLVLDKEVGELHALSDFEVQNQMLLKRGTFLNPADQTLTLKDFVIDTLAASMGSGTYILNGNWTNNGQYTTDSSEVRFIGSSPINHIDGLNPTTFFDLVMDKESGILQTMSDFNVLNLLTLSSGTFENPSGRTINLKDFWIDSPATSQGSGSYLLSGNWINNGTFNADQSMVQFIGDRTMNGIGGLAYTTFYDLVLDKEVGELHAISDFEVQNQMLLKRGTFLNPPDQTLTLKDFVIDTLARSMGAGTYILNGNWINNGNFPSDQESVVQFSGNAMSEISGSSDLNFFKLIIDKEEEIVLMTKDIAINNELNMNQGHLDLNGNNLELIDNGIILNERADSYLFDSQASGGIFKTLALNAPNAVNPGNIGVNITTAVDLGTTTIKRGHAVQTVNGNESIVRYYDIVPTNNSNLNATLQLYYLDDELNSITENELIPYQLVDGEWTDYFVNLKNSIDNWLEFSGVNALSTFTLAPEEVISSVYDEDLGQQVQLFPNPARNQVNLKLAPEFGQALIEIVDLNGRRLFSKLTESGGTTLPIDLQGWPAGMYLVRMEIDGRFFTQKLIVTEN